MNVEKIILLIDDHPDDELLTLRALKRNKVETRVVVVRDGAEAIDYLCRTGEYADKPFEGAIQLIFLDLKLPKLDGLEVLRRLRAHPGGKLIPVVVLTSSKEEEDIVRSYSLGANSYVRKPVDFASFSESVGQLGAYWLLVNEMPPFQLGAAS